MVAAPFPSLLQPTAENPKTVAKVAFLPIPFNKSVKDIL
jgi:hypothetical protein